MELATLKSYQPVVNLRLANRLVLNEMGTSLVPACRHGIRVGNST